MLVVGESGKKETPDKLARYKKGGYLVFPLFKTSTSTLAVLEGIKREGGGS